MCLLVAATIFLTLLRFFISQRVPEPGGPPRGFIEIFTSHRREPCRVYACQRVVSREMKALQRTSSMFPSLEPTARRRDWSVRTYVAASSGDLKVRRTLQDLSVCSDRESKVAYRRSASETISINPVPALFKSMYDVRFRGVYVDLAVSCIQSESDYVSRM
jgi:hypothetical protein